jgi:flagellar biosynthesis/type III secretory pathway protein FliH
LVFIKRKEKQRSNIMRLFNLKKTIIAGTFALATLLGTAEIASSQTRWEIERQRRIQAERIRQEQIRQEMWRRQNRRERNAYNQRYRVYTNSGYYYTDNRGVELLRQAVNRGYQQGFRAGQMDRRYGNQNSYYDSNVYRSGNYGYQSYVDRSQYQYYFQQGFQRGYEDGYYSRYQYGTYRNGVANILGSILGSILNAQPY